MPQPLQSIEALIRAMTYLTHQPDGCLGDAAATQRVTATTGQVRPEYLLSTRRILAYSPQRVCTTRDRSLKKKKMYKLKIPSTALSASAKRDTPLLLKARTFAPVFASWYGTPKQCRTDLPVSLVHYFLLAACRNIEL